jgi:uncharacterized protein YndB with AHSA1/START domain
MIASAADTVLEITRVFDAPPARVFAAWLDLEQFQAWIGPEGVDCEVQLLEPQVGGRYRLVPVHRGFDDLLGAGPQRWQGVWVNEQFDAAGDAGSSSDQSSAFES